jgi:hypothetical protein
MKYYLFYAVSSSQHHHAVLLSLMQSPHLIQSFPQRLHTRLVSLPHLIFPQRLHTRLFISCTHCHLSPENTFVSMPPPSWPARRLPDVKTGRPVSAMNSFRRGLISTPLPSWTARRLPAVKTGRPVSAMSSFRCGLISTPLPSWTARCLPAVNSGHSDSHELFLMQSHLTQPRSLPACEVSHIQNDMYNTHSN